MTPRPLQPLARALTRAVRVPHRRRWAAAAATALGVAALEGLRAGAGVAVEPAPPLALVVVAAVWAAGVWRALPAILVAGAYLAAPALLRAPVPDPWELAAALAPVVLLAPALAHGLRRWSTRERRRGDRARLHRLMRENREARERYAAFVHGLEALVWEAAAGARTASFVNAFVESHLGHPRERWLNEPGFATLVVHPEDRARVAAERAAVLRDGRTRHVEYRVVAKDGWSLWLRESVCVVPGRDGSSGLRGVALDITDRRQAEAALQQEKERYRGLFEGVPVGLYRSAPDGRFLAGNAALARMLGYPDAEALGGITDQQLYAAPEDRWRWQGAVLEEGRVQRFELPWRRRDGTLVWVRNTARAVFDAAGEVLYYEGMIEDISERKRAEEAGRLAEARFRGLVEQSLVGIYTIEGERLVYGNPKLAAIFGYTPQELLALPSFLSLVAEEHRDKVRAFLRSRMLTPSAEPFGFRGRRRDGSVIEVEVHGTRTESNGAPAILGSMLDVTSRKRAEDDLIHTALHDSLTGLPNRAMFMERLEHALLRSRRGDHPFAVLFLDLNRFKVINDSLGHSIGDELLKVVAVRLQRCMRPGDTVARFGGDEFALLLEEVGDVSDATRVAERIQTEIAAPIDLSGYEVYTAASIGIALSAAGYDRPDHVLRSADMAMYRAKASGVPRFEVFDRTMHAEALARLQLETDLRRAVEREEFALEYQPIVCLRTGRIRGLEALVRWEHPEQGRVSPAEFVPMAEEMGLIVPIGRWVLRNACRQLREWQSRYPAAADLSVSVNVSVKQFLQSSVVPEVEAVLEAHPVAPGTLKLEITESVLMEKREAARTVLAQLQRMGVHILLDDFGTGYSSLAYLHNLPLDAVKIDRAFVADLRAGAGGSHMVRTIVNLAHNLGFEVVAEGVAETGQAESLRALGCEYAQGYLYSPPRPAHRIEAVLAEGGVLFPPPADPARPVLVLERGA